jgi:hypothetical protein
VRDQVSQPYKTKDITILLYIKPSVLDRRWEDKRFGTEW